MGMMVDDRLLSAMAAVCDAALAWLDADEAKDASPGERTAEEWAEAGKRRRDAEVSLVEAVDRLRRANGEGV